MRAVILSLSTAAVVALAATFAQAAIVYVDAQSNNTVMALSPDGPVYAGTPLIVTDNSSTADGLWRLRGGFGLAAGETSIPDAPYDAPGSGGDLLENGDWQVADNAPRLRTSVSGLALNTYDVYAYFWDAGGAGWTIRAGLQDTAGTDSLTQYSYNSPGVTEVTDDGAGYEMYQIYLGQIYGTAIDVYIEDLPQEDGNSSNTRTWYDGVGVEVIPEPAALGLFGIFGAILLFARRRR